MTICKIEKICFHSKEKEKNHRSLYLTFFTRNYTEQKNTMIVNVMKGLTGYLNHKELLMLEANEQVIIETVLRETMDPNKSKQIILC